MKRVSTIVVCEMITDISDLSINSKVEFVYADMIAVHIDRLYTSTYCNKLKYYGEEIRKSQAIYVQKIKVYY